MFYKDFLFKKKKPLMSHFSKANHDSSVLAALQTQFYTDQVYWRKL